MYREIRDAQHIMESILNHVRTAILAENTRDMNEYAGAAQAGIVRVKQRLVGINDEGDGGGPHVDRHFLETAVTALERAFAQAEHVAMAVNTGEMRAYLVDFKTYADHADAYLRAALGMEGS